MSKLTKLEIAKNLEIASKAAWVIEKTLPTVKIFNLWKDNWLEIKRNSSWSLKFDKIMWGWFPKGRIIEIFWAESSWKTSMCLVAAAEYTKQWKNVFFLDAEQALDVEYAKSIGVDLNHFFLSQPGHWEEAFDTLNWVIKSCAFDLIIVDSVSALTPKALLEGTAEDATKIWELARLMSTNLKRTNSLLWENWNSTVIFINQVRVKIWWFTMWFWEPTDTTWGKALKFFASVRAEVKKGAPIKRWDEQIWSEVRISTVKNKTASPFQKTVVNLMYDAKNKNYWTSTEKEIADITIEKELLWSRWRYESLTWDKVKSWEIEIEGVLTKLDWKEMLTHYLLQPENEEQLNYLKWKILEWIDNLKQNEDWKYDFSDFKWKKKVDTKKVKNKTEKVDKIEEKLEDLITWEEGIELKIKEEE